MIKNIKSYHEDTKMNFFPNLQIVFNISPPPPPRSVRHVSTNSGSGNEEDIHFYVNLDAPPPPPNASSSSLVGLSVQEAHDQTSLSVWSSENPMYCVVCLTVCEEGVVVQTVDRCGHVFHPACILRWLMQNGSCPVCRIQLG